MKPLLSQRVPINVAKGTIPICDDVGVQVERSFLDIISEGRESTKEGDRRCVSFLFSSSLVPSIIFRSILFSPSHFLD